LHRTAQENPNMFCFQRVDFRECHICSRICQHIRASNSKKNNESNRNCERHAFRLHTNADGTTLRRSSTSRSARVDCRCAQSLYHITLLAYQTGKPCDTHHKLRKPGATTGSIGVLPQRTTIPTKQSDRNGATGGYCAVSQPYSQRNN
jgi:hypothetical protein